MKTRTYWSQTDEGKATISQISSKPRKNRINKGIGSWKIGNKKFRVTLSDESRRTKSITLGYTETFQEAVDLYLDGHKERFNSLPECLYVSPETGEILFNGTIF